MNWIGYFYSLSRYGDFLDAVSPWMNWAHLDIAQTELPQTVEIARRCERLGLSACYSIIPVLWIPQTLPKPYVLHPNWKDRFNYQRPWYDAFVQRGGLHSLYVIDEPTAHGVTWEDLRMVCNYVREAGYKILVLEALGAEAYPIHQLDYYGVTCYTPRYVSEARERIKASTQINTLVIQAFNERPSPIPDQWEWFSVWKELRSRQDAGIALFDYPSYEEMTSTGLRKYIGSQEDQGVRAIHAAMAKEVRGG
jgi:hypothetical protein